MTCLLLVPTEFERATIARYLDGEIQLCGFGPVAAAARTSALICEQRPQHVMLIGIAGTLAVERFPVNSAAIFRDVYLDGVGEGCDFPQWDDIHDRLTLSVPDTPEPRGDLLTVCSPTEPNVLEEKRARYSTCVAEDMEAFGVALSCRLYNVPLTVVRGASNRAGDRDKSNWQFEPAMAAAGRLAAELISRYE